VTLQSAIAAVLVAAGLFFMAAGGIGLLRFPDFYTRLHPAGKTDTFGATLILLGTVVHQGVSLLSLKLLLVEGFILLANPAATHVLGRAARRSGLVPWTSAGRATEEAR
jgi:multicomponent Na+:H+ antiporter subunit G